MNLEEMNKQIAQRMEAVNDFIQGDAKVVMGEEALNHFKASFAQEGFTDKELQPWEDVARRDPSSPWYGHSGFPAVKQKKKKKKGDTTLVGNFSEARAAAKILSGETSQLREGPLF